MMTGFLTSTKERRQRPILAVRISDILCQPDNQQDPKTLQALANRITQTGILQPFPVRKNADQRYELVSGSEQFQAAKLAGLQIVPCILSDNHSRNAEILALVEQIQQQNLSFFEEASAIERLISHYGMTQEDAAAKLGKAQSTIANKLRLLRLTETERDIILQYNLTERHARALLRLRAPEERLQILDKVIKQNLNVEKQRLRSKKKLDSIPPENHIGNGTPSFRMFGHSPTPFIRQSKPCRLLAFLRMLRNYNPIRTSNTGFGFLFRSRMYITNNRHAIGCRSLNFILLNST